MVLGVPILKQFRVSDTIANMELPTVVLSTPWQNDVSMKSL